MCDDRMDPTELIEEVRSGVLQIMVERNRDLVGNATGFLVQGGLVTNSHCIRADVEDAIALRFDNSTSDDNPIRLELSRCEIAAESPESEQDYAFIRLSEPEFVKRHVFEFADSSALSVGEQVLFLGFPFGRPHLTSHLGYVSSIHKDNVGVEIIQIDGSVNGGNSGGPLLDLKSGKVVGIVTRAVKGFIIEEFDRLLEALQYNSQALQSPRKLDISVGGIDPLKAIGKSFAAMEILARDLRRSANVGIGYAYSSNYVRDQINNLRS